MTRIQIVKGRKKFSQTQCDLREAFTVKLYISKENNHFFSIEDDLNPAMKKIVFRAGTKNHQVPNLSRL